MQDDSIEHTIKQYIAAGAAEGAIAAAQKLSKAIGVETGPDPRHRTEGQRLHAFTEVDKQ